MMQGTGSNHIEKAYPRPTCSSLYHILVVAVAYFPTEVEGDVLVLDHMSVNDK